MLKKLIIIGLIIQVVIAITVNAQTKSAFSGDHTRFRSELIAFMGPNLNPAQLANLNTFPYQMGQRCFQP